MTIDIEEALRYAGVPAPPPEELRREMESVAQEVTSGFQPRWHWRLCSVEHRPEGEYLPEAALLLPGRTAKLMLAQCGRAALLCCTLGAAGRLSFAPRSAGQSSRAVWSMGREMTVA